MMTEGLDIHDNEESNTDKQNYIVKGIGGFYYVKTADGLIECKPKGIFRKQHITPLPGDYVRLEHSDNTWVICEVLERKNEFIRPAVANVDVLLLVISTTDPLPNTYVIDQLAAMTIDKGARPVLVLTKTDLCGEEILREDYRTSGIPMFTVCSATGEGLAPLKALIAGNLCVLCGNSGVGKSTLLNALLPNAHLETGETSKKLGRGRHTTRQVELMEAYGGLIADTPGFSSLDLAKAVRIRKENLQFAFPEMQPYLLQCKFTGCSHTREKGCAVIAAVQAGDIGKTRYQSYLDMYRAASEWNDWEL